MHAFIDIVGARGAGSCPCLLLTLATPDERSSPENQSQASSHQQQVQSELPVPRSAPMRVVRSYLLSVAEGTQRVLLERHVPVDSVAAVCIPSLLPSTWGGLCGLVHALSDTGAASLTLCGPHGALKLAESLRHYCHKQYPHVSVAEAGHGARGWLHDAVHSDCAVSVRAFVASLPPLSPASHEVRGAGAARCDLRAADAAPIAKRMKMTQLPGVVKAQVDGDNLAGSARASSAAVSEAASNAGTSSDGNDSNSDSSSDDSGESESSESSGSSDSGKHTSSPSAEDEFVACFVMELKHSAMTLNAVEFRALAFRHLAESGTRNQTPGSASSATNGAQVAKRVAVVYCPTLRHLRASRHAQQAQGYDCGISGACDVVFHICPRRVAMMAEYATLVTGLTGCCDTQQNVYCGEAGCGDRDAGCSTTGNAGAADNDARTDADGQYSSGSCGGIGASCPGALRWLTYGNRKPCAIPDADIEPLLCHRASARLHRCLTHISSAAFPRAPAALRSRDGAKADRGIDIDSPLPWPTHARVHVWPAFSLSSALPECNVLNGWDVARAALDRPLPETDGNSMRTGLVATPHPSHTVDTAGSNASYARRMRDHLRRLHQCGPEAGTLLGSIPADDIEVTVLGTGSARPSKLRGSTAVLIRPWFDSTTGLAGGGAAGDSGDVGNGIARGRFGSGILLDAGEGCYTQLCRRLGRNVAARTVGELRVIFISHHHADHCAGLPQILHVYAQQCECTAYTRDASTTPLLVVAPRQVLRHLAELEQIGSHRLGLASVRRLKTCGSMLGKAAASSARWQPCFDAVHFSALNPTRSMTRTARAERGAATLVHSSRVAPRTVNSIAWSQIGAGWLHSIRAVAVRHCADAHAAVLTVRLRALHDAGAHCMAGTANESFDNNYSSNNERGGSSVSIRVVFSGDTMPTDALVAAGRGAALLIHEATFGDATMEEVEHARRKRHSTVGQALDIAARMGAGHTILTHFSQRYPLLPPVSPTVLADGALPAMGTAFDLISIWLRGGTSSTRDGARMSVDCLPWLTRVLLDALSDDSVAAYVHQTTASPENVRGRSSEEIPV